MDDICIYFDNITVSSPCAVPHFSVWGTIYLKVNNRCFPDCYWDDCLDLLVPMWLTELDSLLELNRSGCVLDFCDGPYQLAIYCIGDQRLKIECIERFTDHSETQIVAYTSLDSFLRQILAFADTVLQQCDKYVGNFRFTAKSKGMYASLDRLKRYVHTFTNEDNGS